MKNVVIVGVGELAEPVPEKLETASSPLDLLEKAANIAFADTNAENIKDEIDTIAAVRTFSDSTPAQKSPFGDPENLPRSVCNRLNIDPQHAIYSSAGGQTPQQLVNEFSTDIAHGDRDVVLLVGVEALANQKALKRAKIKADWSDDATGQVDDRPAKIADILDIEQVNNQMANIPAAYSLFENARRGRLGLSRENYRHACGELFSPFSKTASEHSCAMFTESYDASEIGQISEKNTTITDCYSRAMVAKDGVNQGSAILMMSEDKAKALGISRSKWIYPVSGGTAIELPIYQREALGRSVAMKAAYDATFEAADISMSDVTHMDIYSCFPIAVFSACEALGIEPNDPRGLTVTGGLPFFGGAGNNYSSHGIINIVKKLRDTENGLGLVGANGGYLTKHSAGIYAKTAPIKGWQEADSAALSKIVASQATPEFAVYADGAAKIESYSVEYERKGPKRGYVVGRLPDGRRFYAHTAHKDMETIQTLLDDDPLEKTIFVTSKGPGNRFTFDPHKTRALMPSVPATLEGDYEYCEVKKDGHVLEVTINRPEARNSLTPEANYELEHIFNLFEADPSLWVAILTGAGDKAFSAGNDLKYSASGKQIWTPETGFAGLTSRKNRNKPVIAAVNGFAFGGGFEIALSCDIIVADETAKFALPEVKVGLIAAAGGIFRLPKAVPPHIAKDMILTGRSMDVEEALHYGVVNYKTDAGKVMEKARDIAAQICAASPTAVSSSLEMMNDGANYLDPVQALEQPTNALLNLLASENLQIGIMAFVTKQKPKWKNK